MIWFCSSNDFLGTIPLPIKINTFLIALSTRERGKDVLSHHSKRATGIIHDMGSGTDQYLMSLSIAQRIPESL